MRVVTLMLIVAERSYAMSTPLTPPASTVKVTPLPAPASAVKVEVDLAAAFINVDERYVSVTVEGCKAVIEDKIDLGSSLLRQLTKNLAPAYLRFGGSCNDCVRYNVGGEAPKFDGNKPESKYCYGAFYLTEDRWDRILAFSNATGLPLIFGLNTCFRRGYAQPVPAWDPTNAVMLMNYTKHHRLGEQVAGWELGNEIENTDKWGPANGILDQPAVIANDWHTLKKSVESVFGDVTGGGALQQHQQQPQKQQQQQQQQQQFFGPDMKAEMDFLTPFSPLAKDVIDHATWHYYMFKEGRKVSVLDVFNATHLDNVVESRAAPFAAVFNGRSWVGEYGGAEGGGHTGITDRFADAFWNADQLGLLPYYGVQGQLRQTLTENALGILDLEGNHFAPRPTYFMYLVWKKVMGRSMLNTTSTAAGTAGVGIPSLPSPATLAAAAGATSGAGVGVGGAGVGEGAGVGSAKSKSKSLRAYAACHALGKGAVTVLLLNLDSSALQIELPQVAAKRIEWIMTGKDGDPAASTVLLNGRALATDSEGNPPELQGAAQSNRTPLSLPARSFAFVVLQDAKAEACQ